MEFQDRTIKCATCGREFLFTAKEQDFFVTKGFKEPRHCRECRQQRKQERDQAVAQASGQAYHPGKEMFKVICANCQRETTVPFKPITGKPVLCKDCFIAQRFGATLSGVEKNAAPAGLAASNSTRGSESETEIVPPTPSDSRSLKPDTTGPEITEEKQKSSRQHFPAEGEGSGSQSNDEVESYRIAAKKRD